MLWEKADSTLTKCVPDGRNTLFATDPQFLKQNLFVFLYNGGPGRNFVGNLTRNETYVPPPTPSAPPTCMNATYFGQNNGEIAYNSTAGCDCTAVQCTSRVTAASSATRCVTVFVRSLCLGPLESLDIGVLKICLHRLCDSLVDHLGGSVYSANSVAPFAVLLSLAGSAVDIALHRSLVSDSKFS